MSPKNAEQLAAKIMHDNGSRARGDVQHNPSRFQGRDFDMLAAPASRAARSFSKSSPA